MSIKDQVSSLIDSGYEEPFKALVNSLEKMGDLPVELQDKIKAMGNTPIAEPVIYQAIQKSDEEGKVVIALATLTEQEIMKFSAIEVGSFIHAVEARITDFKDENGIYKITPATEAMQLPNFLQAEQIRKLMVKRDNCVRSWMDNQTDTEKENSIKEFEKIANELADLAFTISGLQRDVLTEWEQTLVVSQVIGSANNAMLSASGKPLAI